MGIPRLFTCRTVSCYQAFLLLRLSVGLLQGCAIPENRLEGVVCLLPLLASEDGLALRIGGGEGRRGERVRGAAWRCIFLRSAIELPENKVFR